MNLVEITPENHGVDIEIAYATPNNFTGNPIYQRTACYLHSDAEILLRVAIQLANKPSLRLKIFDAFRPAEAQWVLWNHTPDPNFLADPRYGSPHSRGAAIDLTLIDGSGRELEMGTEFDAFTPLSHHGNQEVSVVAQKNRMLLMGLMTTAGWDFYRNEWWHFQMFNSLRYPALSDSVLPNGLM